MMNPGSSSVAPNGETQPNGAPSGAPVGVRSNRILDLVFRWRYALHVLIYSAAFAISWIGPQGAHAQRVWLALPEAASNYLSQDLHSAILATTGLVIFCAFAGAFLRTWGAAYLGANLVVDSAQSAPTIIVDGPYRFLRNPLYLGTIFHTLAISVLMSWAGAAFAIVGVVGLQTVLISAEERFLLFRWKEPYRAYLCRTPRFLPRLSGPASTHKTKAQWPAALAGEIYMWGVAITFVALGANYNATLILQGLLVSLGLSIVVRGLLSKR